MATYRKAILAAVLAAVGAFTTASMDGVITPVEWSTVVAAAVVAFIGVYNVPNAKS